jgi:hypothetical protein
MDETAVCARCGEPARLLCSGCGRTFCIDHLERRFAMGYHYFCPSCLEQVLETCDRPTVLRVRRKKRS